jgi:hypothetical protein
MPPRENVKLVGAVGDHGLSVVVPERDLPGGQAGYEGWVVIETFGNALPDLAAATRRSGAESEEQLASDGFGSCARVFRRRYPFSPRGGTSTPTIHRIGMATPRKGLNGSPLPAGRTPASAV